MASNHVSLSEARGLDGLRLVVIRGVPSPWTQAAKGLLRIKTIEHTLAQQTQDDPPSLLREWTGQESYPVVAYADEPTRSGWAEILLLLERLKPEPALIPADPAERAMFFGLCHEVCGEMGLAWCRRIEGIHAGMQTDPPNPASAYMAPKYGYCPETVAQAPQRVVDVLTLLRNQLGARRKAGHRYFLGELTHISGRLLVSRKMFAAPMTSPCSSLKKAPGISLSTGQASIQGAVGH